MPLELKIETDQNIQVGIWNTTEEASYFSKKLIVHESEKNIIQNLKSRKKLEWLSSRYLLHLMSGRKVRGKFEKDIHGKPHLNGSDFHISISHSKSHISVIASPLSVGIDIQCYVKNITRIQHKFVNPVESKIITPENTINALHIIWSAKESLYKAYGKRALDFKKHLHISNLNPNLKKGTFKGLIQKEDFSKEFDLFYHLFSKYILVYAKESC